MPREAWKPKRSMLRLNLKMCLSPKGRICSIPITIPAARRRRGAPTTERRMALDIWAPHAQSVSLTVRGECVPLSRSKDGYWTCHFSLRHGEDYAIQLDNGNPLPDPRSP